MRTTQARITRRETLKLGAAAVLGAAMGSASAMAVDGALGGPSIHVYSDYGWLRGFSVVPSWGARIEQAWWDYDGNGLDGQGFHPFFTAEGKLRGGLEFLREPPAVPAPEAVVS
ncbi:MAG: hypothetical protein GX547_00310 [Phycisphaerae bacterium]|nr:hypothetical protein [Phycisphaerae bacterium]